MIAAPVWHYWIGLLLFIVALITVVAVVFGYLGMITSQRYPSRDRQAKKQL